MQSRLTCSLLHLAPNIRTTRTLHTSRILRNNALTNIIADGPPPDVQIKNINQAGIQLADGLIIPSACIFLEGKVFLWDVPPTIDGSWKQEHFEVFDVVVPKPEILLFGTGKKVVQPPPFLRKYLNQIGIQMDVMDTWNACSTYNLLIDEGRRVAAALLPTSPRTWRKPTSSR